MARDLMTAKEAAAEIGCAYATVLRWIKDGTLPGFRLGHQYRVKRADVDRLLGREAA